MVNKQPTKENTFPTTFHDWATVKLILKDLILSFELHGVTLLKDEQDLIQSLIIRAARRTGKKSG
jgi:hypothetical protein